MSATIGSAMIFYRYFAGQGREALAKFFDAADPFALSPAEIVERVFATGHKPDVRMHAVEAFRTFGQVFEVHRDGQDFLVAIGRDAEEISVQEIRADPYMPFA